MPSEENASLLFLQSIVIDKKILTINIWQLNSITQNKNTCQLLKNRKNSKRKDAESRKSIVAYALCNGSKTKTMGWQWWMRSQQRLMNVEWCWADWAIHQTTLPLSPPRAWKPCSLFQWDYNQLHHLCISLDRCINGVLLWICSASSSSCYTPLKKKKNSAVTLLYSHLH